MLSALSMLSRPKILLQSVSVSFRKLVVWQQSLLVEVDQPLIDGFGECSEFFRRKLNIPKLEYRSRSTASRDSARRNLQAV